MSGKPSKEGSGFLLFSFKNKNTNSRCAFFDVSKKKPCVKKLQSVYKQMVKKFNLFIERAFSRLLTA
jgi:hypothetical protein